MSHLSLTKFSCNFFLSKYQCSIEDILSPEISTFLPLFLQQRSVCWMRCKFNQELGGNLLSKTFLLEAAFLPPRAWESSASSAQAVKTLSKLFSHQFIEISESWYIEFVASLFPHFVPAIAELFVSQSPFNAGTAAFCHLFCPHVYWPGDVIMTSECLQAFLFCGSHCTTVDLNYGGKNGVSGHLVTLRLPPLGKPSFKKKRNFMKLFHKRGGGVNQISYLLFRNVMPLKKREKIKIRIS